MKYAVIYARYSSERQTEQSIEGQLRECNKFAEQNGLVIVDTYIDRAMTGTNDHRAAFQQMLSDCEKPVVWDVVLVYAIDRFGRNSIEVAINKQRLKKHNKVLISATQRTADNLDGSKNLDGILLENVYIGLAEYYSAELSQKVKRGLHESRLKGYCCGGTMPYGYYLENRKPHINEDQAEIVRYIFQEYVQGKFVKEIITNLTAKGILNHNKPFAKNTIYYMLRLEKYIGITRYSNGEVYDNIYPAIVPKPLFNEVQNLLYKNKLGSRSKDTDYLLRNKIFCGYCGSTMQGECGTSRNGTVKRYYKCAGRKNKHICNKQTIPKDLLENIVIEATRKIFTDADSVEYIAESLYKLHKQRMQDKSILNILLYKKSEMQESLDNLLKAVEQGIFTSTTKNRMEEIEKEICLLDDKIMVEQYKENSIITKEQIIEFLTHSCKQLPKLLIQNLIQKIFVYDDKIEIYYNYVDKMPSKLDDETDQEEQPEGSSLIQSSAPTRKQSCQSAGLFFYCRTFQACLL